MIDKQHTYCTFKIQIIQCKIKSFGKSAPLPLTAEIGLARFMHNTHRKWIQSITQLRVRYIYTRQCHMRPICYTALAVLFPSKKKKFAPSLTGDIHAHVRMENGNKPTVNSSRISRIHFCAKNTSFCHSSQLGRKCLKKSPKHPLPFGAHKPYLIHECLSRPHSPCQTTAWLHNYAKKASLVRDAPNSPQNYPFPFNDDHPYLIHHPRPTPLTIPNGIRIQSAVLPQYTFWTDTRPTDGLGDRSVTWAITLRERRANVRLFLNVMCSGSHELCVFW